MGKSTPTPPSPAQLFNASGQVTPFGSVTSGSGGQVIKQSKGLKKATKKLSNQLLKRVSNLPTGQFSFSEALDDPRIAEALAKNQLGLLQPGFDRQLDRFNLDFTNRGLPVGSEAFQFGLNPILEQQNRTTQSVADSSTAQALQLALQERQLPFQEAGAGLGLLSGVPIPSFPNVNPANLLNTNFQNQVALSGDSNAALGSIFGAGASLAAAPLTGGSSLFGLGLGGLGIG